MDEKKDQTSVGGIHAREMRAENVVYGYQQTGGDLSQAAEAVALAEALSHGRITADSLEARNVVAGFQYIADPAQATPDELRRETAWLRAQLAAAVQEAAADLPPELAADLANAQTALAQAEEELAQEEPAGRRVIRQLKTAAEILTETGKMTEAAQKVGQIVLKWAPAAAALYQIAQKLFGG